MLTVLVTIGCEIGHPSTETWSRSRSGAWAGRGFHYQHLVSTLILVRQWTGLAPSGFLVPEGQEDCVVELADHEIWIQSKSRKDGMFSDAEVRQILAGVEAKATAVAGGTGARSAVVLEQPSPGMNGTDIDQLFEDPSRKVFICRAPWNEIVSLLSTHLGTAEVIAEGITSDLYYLIADASQENASLPFEKRRRISTTEVERRIFERLEAEDPSAIDSALASGILEPVDFITPVGEPSFYQGVKVRPGHVAAGLVLNRPREMKDVVDALKRRRAVLLSGPSGAGKSALMWLSANALSGEFRWYQIAGRAIAADASAVIRFVRARRPSETSPIGLVFDEVGSSSSDLWDILVRELRDLPAVYFLGSVRQEDVGLIANRSDTEFIAVSLDEGLAQTFWENLYDENQTTWTHWREPFEQSEGLMLEYVHLLTQGRRLAAVIEDQVRQREREGRNDELAIIRSTAVLCARGGEVEAGKLFELLGIESHAASRALHRLIDEHLVRESRPGVLGGLHLLRSEALREASHDEVAFLTADSLWWGIAAATHEAMPRIVQSILAEAQGEAESTALRKLAETLGASHDLEVWVSILTGLGLATTERHVTSLTTILEEYGVQRAQWSFASGYASTDLEIPEILSESEQGRSLRNAVLAFRALPKHDLRPACLELLPEGTTVPPCRDLRQANRLLSCLAPICGGEPVPMTLALDFTSDDEQDIRQVAALLSTAYLIGPEVAERWVDDLGGEQALFTRFRSQTPWVSTPVIEPSGTHGRTVRSDWFHVAERYQPDPHETVVNICKTLIALSPGSDAAASAAVDPLGQPITVGSFTPWSKNMPRRNIPAKPLVAWNVAFRQILLARLATDSLTDYARKMAQLVQRTEKVFRSATEKWIKKWVRGENISISNVEALAVEIDEIVGAVNALAYATPEQPSSAMTAPAQGGGAEDTLGALLKAVLENLLGRLLRVPGEEGIKAIAAFAGDQAAKAQEHERSDIWRTMSSPPRKELTALSERLGDVSCIVHEMAHDDSPKAIRGIVKAARKGALGKAVHAAAQRCRFLADQRFRHRLRDLESALKERGWRAQCWSRPIGDSGYWPAKEVAILVEIADFETDAHYIEDGLAIGQQYLRNDWRFRVVPVMNGQVLASLALLPSSHTLLPDQDFVQEWQEHIDQPFLSSDTLERFDGAIVACTQLSGIMACRELENLHPEEEEECLTAIESFKRNREIIAEAAASTGSELLMWILDILNRSWNQVVSELEAVKAEQVVEEPLYLSEQLALAGQENERTTELAGARILILQAECGG
ncbi:MAG: hypothetical protein OXM87_02270 [Truepera sp.]|nr:hypothetical protein [Truepera sp.]